MSVRYVPVLLAAVTLAAVAFIAGCGPPQAPFVRYKTVAYKIGSEQMGQDFKDFSPSRRRDIDRDGTLLNGPDDPSSPRWKTPVSELMSPGG
jgi:hypothetical protein